jgi:predicted dehydrogenase
VLGRVPEPRAAVAEREGTRIVGLLGILGTAPWAAFEASSRRRRSFREVRLFCAGGAATLSDSYSDHLLIRRAAPALGRPPEPERRPISTELPLLRQLRAFVEYVKGGPPPKSNAAAGLEIVRAIDRLRALASL